jgi:SAM-dependent methyltransferase
MIRFVKAPKNVPAILRAITRSKKANTAPKDWFAGISDEMWLWINTAGRRRFKSIAHMVPGLPDPTMQAKFTGSAGDSTLLEGFTAYRLFKRCYESHIGPIGSCKGILDFGCGWGRIIRFWLRDVLPGNVSGVDHNAEAIQVCNETNKWSQFALIEPYPPTSLPADGYDLIYLYSVFSHLPEAMHWELLKEFRRLLAPGGLLMATTRARTFIEFCESLRHDPQLKDKPDWLSQSAKVFLDTKGSLADYDAGKFCYGSLGMEGRWSFWGEACIPRAYAETRWTELFDVLDYIDDPEVCPQNVIVARKRGST